APGAGRQADRRGLAPARLAADVDGVVPGALAGQELEQGRAERGQEGKAGDRVVQRLRDRRLPAVERPTRGVALCGLLVAGVSALEDRLLRAAVRFLIAGDAGLRDRPRVEGASRCRG